MVKCGEIHPNTWAILTGKAFESEEAISEIISTTWNPCIVVNSKTSGTFCAYTIIANLLLFGSYS